jgi:hypothetical protein
LCTNTIRGQATSGAAFRGLDWAAASVCKYC